ncbi:putative beta-catenin family protein 1 [Cardiosporidium cionae]|uniref:Beta-catenin family protein 1 n=1 Tax=Cardiosporidium cionae TaxID=476202 RepID=A0ABQ7JBA1_9APIC|nr:putative beta-catenin family protein 1 [Cardiosporidium cionae]|eukprot:KAF8821277.1 putative beta-catenin family protein 1 [Cardiosporidium cionae]
MANQDKFSAFKEGGNNRRTAAQAGLDRGMPDTIDPDQIQKLLDEADDVIIDTINVNNIRRVLAQLDKRIKKNQQDRIKFSDEPEKWIKSEVDLDEEIKKIKQIATLPKLYGEFINLGGIQMLLGLLNHINTDIAVEVIDALSEITDPDTVAEVENPENFIMALLDSQLPELTIDTVVRINEDDSSEDFQAVSTALQVVENIIDLKPELCDRFFKVSKFVPWLLKRIRHSTIMDYNRVYASEILSIMLQNSAEAREIIGQKGGIDGIDKLLRSIAAYRKRDPESSEEEEFVQNLFDCLCNLMLVGNHQITFGKAQGLELMIRMMRERKFSCGLAVRLTNFALNNCPPNCELFVEKLGLKSIFSMFMRKGVSLKKGSSAEKQLEEHLTAIIQSLCKCCSGNSMARVMNKFMEMQCEKLERILELHEKYKQQVENAQSFTLQRREAEALNKELDINEEEQLYLDRCESGLFVLQQVDIILIRLASMGNTTVSNRIYTLLQNRGIDKEDIQKTVLEYCKNLDLSAKEESAILQQYLNHFLEEAESIKTDLEQEAQEFAMDETSKI